MVKEALEPAPLTERQRQLLDLERRLAVLEESMNATARRSASFSPPTCPPALQSIPLRQDHKSPSIASTSALQPLSASNPGRRTPHYFTQPPQLNALSFGPPPAYPTLGTQPSQPVQHPSFMPDMRSYRSDGLGSAPVSQGSTFGNWPNSDLGRPLDGNRMSYEHQRLTCNLPSRPEPAQYQYQSHSPTEESYSVRDSIIQNSQYSVLASSEQMEFARANVRYPMYSHDPHVVSRQGASRALFSQTEYSDRSGWPNRSESFESGGGRDKKRKESY